MMSVCAIVVVAMITLTGADELETVPNVLIQAHPKNCSAFYEYLPKQRHCDRGLVFIPQKQRCDLPDKAYGPCKTITCPPPSNNNNTNNRSHWEPPTCANEPTEIGGTCQLVCDPDYQLSGASELHRTEQGWNGTTGINQIPSCKSVIETGEDFINHINETLGTKANLLFVLDESGSINKTNFDIELGFVKAIVRAFPLSENRSAGVITFDNNAAVVISIKQSDTCNFLKELDNITYNGGETDILHALSVSYDEITGNAVHNLTLVLLVTDGRSDTDPKEAADNIKSNGNFLLTVGVAAFDEKQIAPLSSRNKNDAPLFYGIKSFEVFEAIGKYLNTTYSNGSSLDC